MVVEANNGVGEGAKPLLVAATAVDGGESTVKTLAKAKGRRERVTRRFSFGDNHD